MKKKFISLYLVVIMLIGMIPAISVNAEDPLVLTPVGVTNVENKDYDSVVWKFVSVGEYYYVINTLSGLYLTRSHDNGTTSVVTEQPFITTESTLQKWIAFAYIGLCIWDIDSQPLFIAPDNSIQCGGAADWGPTSRTLFNLYGQSSIPNNLEIKLTTFDGVSIQTGAPAMGPSFTPLPILSDTNDDISTLKWTFVLDSASNLYRIKNEASGKYLTRNNDSDDGVVDGSGTVCEKDKLLSSNQLWNAFRYGWSIFIYNNFSDTHALSNRDGTLVWAPVDLSGSVFSYDQQYDTYGYSMADGLTIKLLSIGTYSYIQTGKPIVTPTPINSIEKVNETTINWTFIYDTVSTLFRIKNAASGKYLTRNNDADDGIVDGSGTVCERSLSSTSNQLWNAFTMGNIFIWGTNSDDQALSIKDGKLIWAKGDWSSSTYSLDQQYNNYGNTAVTNLMSIKLNSMGTNSYIKTGLNIALTFGTYKVSADNYISNVDPQATVLEFKEELLIGTAFVAVKDKNGNPLGDTDVVTTGTKVEITNGTTTNTYTIVIFGDVDGISGIEMGDLVAIRDHLLEATPLDGAYFAAGDLYADEDITLNSLVGLMAYVSESGTINQDLFAYSKKN